MNIKELKDLSLEEVIKKIHQNEITDVVVYTLPLDTALTNFPVSMMGNFIVCISGTTVTTNVDITFNKVLSGAINFTQGLGVARPFDIFFVSCAAQAGASLTFLISSYSPELFGIQDNRSNNLQAQYLSDIRDELQGGTTLTNPADISVSISAVVLAAAARKACSFYADLANTDVIYLGNASVSATRKMITLSPGDFISLDDYAGAISAIAGSGTQKLSVSNW